MIVNQAIMGENKSLAIKKRTRRDRLARKGLTISGGRPKDIAVARIKGQPGEYLPTHLFSFWIVCAVWKKSLHGGGEFQSLFFRKVFA